MSVMGSLEWLGRLAQTHPGAVVLAFGLVMLLGLILRATIGRAPKQVLTTHGSARWATRRECRHAGLFGHAGLVLGHAWGHYLRFDGEEHVALIGPTRSWKGRAHIIPSLLTADRVPWSVLVTDPKDGENAAVTARWRERCGPVWRFTPRAAAHEKINVLDTIRLKTRMEFGDAHLIAQSLVAPEKLYREHPTSLHFRELAALLLTAVMLHVLYTGRRRSLAGVWAFMTQEHTSLPACLKAMSQTRHTSAGVHQAIVSMTRAVQNITGDRELSSVWSTAIRPLVLYNDALVAESTDTSTVNLDDLQYGPTPVSLYLIAPSPMELDRLHPVYRVVLEVAMMRLMSHQVRSWSHRLRLIGDEFPSYGYMRVMEKGVSVMAGYGMQACLVMQDLEQLWEVYGEHTQIWGNCKVKLFHAPDNDLTAKRISENLLGEQTVENPVAQQTPVLGHRRSISLQHTGRPLLTPDELMNLPEDQLIVRVRGIPPVRATKCDYRTDPAFAGRWEEIG